MTAGCRSHAILGLSPILLRKCRSNPGCDSPFRSRCPPTFDRRRSHRARSPFTRPCRSFWSAFDELIWDPTSPADFCNEIDVRALNPSSHDPRRDGRRDALPFVTPRAGFFRNRRAAASRASSAPSNPGVASSRLSPGFPDHDVSWSAPPPTGCPGRSPSGESTCTGQRTK
jgi:hypothetical protein